MPSSYWRNDPRARVKDGRVILVMQTRDRGLRPVLEECGIVRVRELTTLGEHFADPDPADVVVIETDDFNPTIAGIAATTLVGRSETPPTIILVVREGRAPDHVATIPWTYVTKREGDVVQEIVDGLEPADIAKKWGVSYSAIYAHLESLKDNFGVPRLRSLIALLRGFRPVMFRDQRLSVADADAPFGRPSGVVVVGEGGHDARLRKGLGSHGFTADRAGQTKRLGT